MINLRIWGARYHCPHCGVIWTGYTGPQEGCPTCLAFTEIVWANFEEMAAKKFKGYPRQPPPLENGI